MLYSMNSSALLILFGGYWNSELPYEPFNSLLGILSRSIVLERPLVSLDLALLCKS